MQISETANQQLKLVVTPAEARIFVNCFAEVDKAISDNAFQARVGGERDDIKALFSAIQVILK